MKNLIINKELDSNNVNSRPQELQFALEALRHRADEKTDYDIIEDSIVEYDLTETKEPIYWHICDVKYEGDDVVKEIMLDC